MIKTNFHNADLTDVKFEDCEGTVILDPPDSPNPKAIDFEDWE